MSECRNCKWYNREHHHEHRPFDVMARCDLHSGIRKDDSDSFVFAGSGNVRGLVYSLPGFGCLQFEAMVPIRRHPPKFQHGQTVYISTDEPPCRLVFGLQLAVIDIMRANDESCWLYLCQRTDTDFPHRWYRCREEWLTAPGEMPEPLRLEWLGVPVPFVHEVDL